MNGDWLCCVALWGVGCGVWDLGSTPRKVRGASFRIFSGIRIENFRSSRISKKSSGSVDAKQRGVLFNFTVLTSDTPLYDRSSN